VKAVHFPEISLYFYQTIWRHIPEGNSYTVYSYINRRYYLSSSLLTRNESIQLYKHIILPFVYYGFKLGLFFKASIYNGCLRTWSWWGGDIWEKELTGGWRELCNEELHNLYYRPNIIRIIKSRSIIRWAGQIERTEGMRHEYWISFGNLKGKGHLDLVR
jgi:hypothetical protein